MKLFSQKPKSFFYPLCLFPFNDSKGAVADYRRIYNPLLIVFFLASCGEVSVSENGSEEPDKSQEASKTEELDLQNPKIFDRIVSQAYSGKFDIVKEHNGVKKIEYFVDEDGNRISGWVKLFHKNSQQLAFLAYLKNGMLHGHLDRFYENGSPLSKEHYQNGEKHGVCVYWRENGIKKEEGVWKNGLPDGEKKLWYSNGQKEVFLMTKDGKYIGQATEWYQNGQKKSEISFSYGKPESIIVWKPNGEYCPTTKMSDGKGVVVSYNDDGTEKNRFNFKDGEKVKDVPMPTLAEKEEARPESVVDQIVDGSDATMQSADDTTSIDIDVLHRIARDWYMRLRLHEIDDETIQIEATSEGIKVTLFHGEEKPLFEKSSSKLTRYGRKVMQRMSWILSQHVLVFRIDSHSYHSGEVGGVDSDVSAWHTSLEQGKMIIDALFHYSGGELSGKLECITGHAITKPNSTRDPDQSEKNRRVELSLVLDFSHTDLQKMGKSKR